MKKTYLPPILLLLVNQAAYSQSTVIELKARIAELESLVTVLQSKLAEVDMLNTLLFLLTGVLLFLFILFMNLSFRKRILGELNAVKRQLMVSMSEEISTAFSFEEVSDEEEVKRREEYIGKLKELSVPEKIYTVTDWIIRGLDHYYREEFDLALKAFDGAVKKDGLNGDARFDRAVVLSRLGYGEDAEKEYRHSLELNPRSAECWYYLGLELESLEKSEEAVEAFRKAVDLKPDNPAAYRKLGLDLRKLERKEEAVQAYNRMGDTLIRLGREEEAVEAYSNMAVDLIKLGLSDERDNQSDNGAIDLEALEQEQEALDSYYAMGSRFSELGRNEEALEAYGEILKIKPEDREAKFCMARTQARMGLYEEAEKNLKSLVESAATHARAWYLYGKVLTKLGHEEEAVEAFNTVARLKPEVIQGERKNKASAL